ncbi:EutN/CcmL family microcompartment protein [Proteus sp. TJ1640]|uniref:EutN/CcmL family microcompartment protein n=1 Tax=Proteus TaxID=583 RepID=UPI000197D9A1|nr:EutN/CcmL family microcompartment protein [Proteus sp. TJ1640]EEG87335.1 ethanolamine utilization protein EutN/carboxysome structural protein Ccml [Proteus penneri ATCC 35198]
MILAKVIGHVVATQKSPELKGSNLLMVATLDDELNPLKNKTYVAVDSVGAGINDIVLAEEYFALNKERYKAMSVVAIVEKVYRDSKE